MQELSEALNFQVDYSAPSPEVWEEEQYEGWYFLKWWSDPSPLIFGPDALVIHRKFLQVPDR